MLTEWLNLLPASATQNAKIGLFAGALVGLFLWVFGARLSRHITTLVLLAVGAVVGLESPAWFGWSVNGSAVAVGTALVGGLLGYALHRLWLGAILGAFIAMWATFVTWLVFKDQAVFAWPAWAEGVSRTDYLRATFDSLPEKVRSLLPYVAMASMATGVAFGILWPRVAKVLTWSLVGATLVAAFGSAALKYTKPEWLDYALNRPSAQPLVLAGLVLFGAILQWHTRPAEVLKVRRPKEEDEE